MESKIVYLAFIFIIYSCLGWILESVFMSIKKKKFINRGVLNGPFILTYGISLVILSIAFFDTKNIPLILIGSLIYTTFLQLTSGKLLLSFKMGRWWDYSKKMFNLEGLICPSMSLLWAFLSTISLLTINPLLTDLLNMMNYTVVKIVLMSILIIILIDFIISYMSLTKDNKKVIKSKTAKSISSEIYNRVSDAYPSVNDKKTFDADSFNVYKFFIYLILGGCLGCFCEMIFCRLTMGIWMSRSSLVYGEISLVWGIAFAIFTTYLHSYRGKSSLFVFIYGLILGTAFEYLCGAFCEYIYGYSFWDYNHLPLNINGRVQLVFALIWGFSALIYIKFVYKRINNLLVKIPEKLGKIVVSSLVVILILDIALSIMAGIRFSERQLGYAPSNIIEEFCDKHFTDDFFKNRFKTLKVAE